ncbi:MAG: ABC-type multidrug transport system ATPase subunit [Cyclobacteriaceae bacterium]
MDIVLEKVGKKYNKQWVFKNLSVEIPSKSCIAITGANGSGKSTLMQIIAGYLSPSAGLVKYNPQFDELQLHFSYTAPYFELIEEFTLIELLNFHAQFKKATCSNAQMLEKSQLTKSANKQISMYSSGMKQRVKLILAFFFESKVLFLDEPTANLDDEGINWYKEEIQNITNQNIIIASNQLLEYENASQIIKMEKFK